jgi:ribonuclease Z
VTKLEVIFLGTSSATPTRTRSLPSIALTRDGQVVLLDCGEGAQTRFVKFGIGLNKEMLVLITHLHGDHVNGLLGLLQTMSMSQRVRTLTIVAPAALFEWLEITIRMLHIGLSFDVRMVPVKAGIVLRGKDFRIRAGRADHSIEAWSYIFEELERPGVFDPKKAIALGIPEGRKWSSLQHGRKISSGGVKIVPSQVMGPPRRGRKVGYSGDTRPTRTLAKFFAGMDLLIFDSTFATKDRDRAVERKHSTAAEAALIAKDAAVKQLALTHFSARYKGTSQLLREARMLFKETVAAKDGLMLEIPQYDIT